MAKKFEKTIAIGKAIKETHKNSLLKKIKVEESIKQFIRKLNSFEYEILEKDILKNGCLTPIILWEKSKDKYIIVDGHNRYSICKKHKIDFEIEIREFENLNEVHNFMLTNQLGRRNLTEVDKNLIIGNTYINRLALAKGKQKSETGFSLKEELTQLFKISESKLKRCKSYTIGYYYIQNNDPDEAYKINEGNSIFIQSDIIYFGSIQFKDSEETYLSIKGFKENGEKLSKKSQVSKKQEKSTQENNIFSSAFKKYTKTITKHFKSENTEEITKYLLMLKESETELKKIKEEITDKLKKINEKKTSDTN